ncbi:MAG: hypothetical protein AB1782_02705 [Cyanobacteriota bacterium]
MKGFLKVFLIILAVAIISLLLVGGICWYTGSSLYDDIKQQATVNDPKLDEARAKSIVGYTLPVNYQLLKAIDINVLGFGLKSAMFQYVPNSQFLILAEPPKMLINIDETNFKSKLSPEEVEKALRQSGRSDVTIENFTVVNEGTIPTATREIPYVEVKTTIKNHRTGNIVEFEGIISVMTFSNGKKNVILLSGNKSGNFDIAAAKDFIKTIDIN